MSDITSHVPLAPLSPEARAAAALGDLAGPVFQTEQRLRLWPALLLVLLQWLAIGLAGYFFPGTMYQFMVRMWAPIVCAVALVLWWLFASRIRWRARLLGLLALAALAGAVFLVRHDSLAVIVLFVFALPVITTAWAGWLLVAVFLPWTIRFVGLLIVLALACGYFSLIRFEGIDGSMTAAFEFRWAPTAEERYQAEREAKKADHSKAVAPDEKMALQTGDWPGFRGPNRDGRRPGVRLATDWEEHPPELLWKQRIGPGWSSFAVVGDRLFTQQQLGDYEMVVCYHAATGEELWEHKDRARFSEIVAGPGPRATPTFHDGKVYALGAAGRLNCLDAATGEVVWSQDIAEDSGATAPTWGFSSSPLVVQGTVIVFAGGPDGKSVVAYDALKGGKPKWMAGKGELSYCSPQLARIDGGEQVLITTENGLTAFAPATGKVLWEHEWFLKGMARVVQPTLVSDSDVLLGSGFGFGTRRVRVRRDGNNWKTEPVWTTKAISPYYNDLVIHKGHIYGFDGMFFTCVKLDDGERKWRVRGYGNGQVLLLPEQDLLLVLSEKGAVALLEASPEGHRRLGQFQAIEGKTWNHPVVAHGKLFVRNGEKVACYQLAADSARAE
jgi:outer membrane protein assembly factor BamB